MTLTHFEGGRKMKFKKLLFFILTALFSTLMFSQSALASTFDENSTPIEQQSLPVLTGFDPVIDYETLSIQESIDSITFFDNIDDMSMYVSIIKTSNSDVIGTEPMSAVGKTLIGTQYKDFYFMGYSKYTPDWQRNKEYTVSKGDGQTYSTKVNTKWGDVSASFTLSEGVSRTISADNTRWSRLAGYADLKIQRFKSSGHNFGTIYTTKVTKLNLYTDVKYK